MRGGQLCATLTLLCLAIVVPVTVKAEPGPAWADTGVKAIVTSVIAPVMRQYGIPGMAVGIVVGGQIYVCNYGAASKATGRAVDARTLFEIGSISKTFNATLATYAEARGAVRFSDMASKYLPALRGRGFDHISLLDLGTYTAGGLPLQFPDQINDNSQLMAWLKHWKPAYSPGTVRRYSNMSIGLFGLITATGMQADYAKLIQNQLFPELGLHHSFLNIPADENTNYAQGYENDGTPIRLADGVLVPEYVGVRTTAADLARFIAINMGMFDVSPAWQQAVSATHTGYDQLQAGGMVQDLVWEQYELPVDLRALEAGNGYRMLRDANPVKAITPPLPPQTDVLLNKSGSTNGFSAYVAYIPAHQIGIVLLANRAFPISVRVSAAYEILRRLDANLDSRK